MLKMRILTWATFVVGLVAGASVMYWQIAWYWGVIGGQIFGIALNHVFDAVERAERCKRTHWEPTGRQMEQFEKWLCRTEAWSKKP